MYDSAPWWVQTRERSEWLKKLRSQKPWRFHRTGSLAVFRPDDLDSGKGARIDRCQANVEDEQTGSLGEVKSQCMIEKLPLKSNEAGPATNLEDEWGSVQHSLQSNAGKSAEEGKSFLSASESLIIPTRTCVVDGPGHVRLRPHKLCVFCREAFEGAISYTNAERRPRTLPWGHHPDYASLNASVTESCPLCQVFIMEYVKSTSKDPMAFKENIMTFWYSRTGRSGIEDRPLINYLQYKFGLSKILFYEFSDLHRNDESLFRRRKISRLPDLELGREWVQTCIRDHHCDEARTSELPTRLLDVGMSTKQAKLVDTNTMIETQDCHYAALSHCWGARLPDSRTTRANVHARAINLDLDSLEQTFKDAITVARTLGYHYLWIDTLCIVQDDESDWKKECSHMDAVFSNAVVTIAALDASDAFAGFLQPRELPEECDIACQVSLHGPEGWAENIIVSRHQFDRTDDRMRQWTNLLGKRAWCLQEQLLSTRTLSFSKFQMGFECQLCRRSDLHVQWPLAPESMTTGFRLRKDDYLPPWIAITHSNIEEQNLSHFLAAAEEYSKRSLSFPRDKLPAFSGLARRFYQSCQDDYLAGIWRRDLVRSLCWSMCYRDYQKWRYESPEYIAPSWSWASVHASISYRAVLGNFRSAVEIVGASTSLLGNDPFGEVSSGEIKVKAWINECKLHCEIAVESYSFCLRRKPNGSPIAGVVFDKCADNVDSSKHLVLTCILLGAGDTICSGLTLQLVDSTSATYRRTGNVKSWDADASMEFENMIKEGEYKEIRLV